MFFLQGTQLLQLETEYAMIAEDITLCARTVNRRRGELSSLKEAEKEARAAHAEGLKAQKKKDRAATLKREQAWAHVRDKQNELDEKQNIVGICEERLQRANAKVPDTDVSGFVSVYRIQVDWYALGHYCGDYQNYGRPGT